MVVSLFSPFSFIDYRVEPGEKDRIISIFGHFDKVYEAEHVECVDEFVYEVLICRRATRYHRPFKHPFVNRRMYSYVSRYIQTISSSR